MFMSALWDTIFSINDKYKNASVFLIDNHIPALRFGTADKPIIFAGGFGAQEWQSAPLLLKFFDTLLADMEAGKTIAGIAARKAFKRRSIIIIPAVCPPKMRYEDENLVISDLSPLAKYLAYHSAGMLVCISGSNGHIYCAQENESLSRDADTVGKILCACSKLPQAQDDSGISAKFCNWTSQKALLPSFVLSPPSLEASALEYNYKALEETFAVCSLL